MKGERMKQVRTLLLSAAVALYGGPLTAATWIVDQGGQGDFTTIVDAVASATESDTIWVRPGTYVGWVKFSPNKGGILLKGDGPVESIVVQSDTIAVSISGTTLPVRIENLTLTGSHLYGAIFVFKAKAEIVGCIVRDNVGPGDCNGVGGGGTIQQQSDVLVQGCLFEDNHSWESPGGLIVWSSRAVIRGNVFRNNSSCYGGGLEMYHCEGQGLSVIEGNLFLNNDAESWGGGIFNVDSSPDIRGNTLSGNGGLGRAAIWVLGGSPNIHHNIIVGSNEAIYCQSLADYPASTPLIGENMCWDIANTHLSNCGSIVGLKVADPLFCDAAGGNYGLCADSPAVEDSVAVYGAFPVECDKCLQTPVMTRSWGWIKANLGGERVPADSTSPRFRPSHRE
jgi:hypothetical protein